MSSDAPFVSVTVGSIPPDDQAGKYAVGDTASVWADVMIVNRFESDKHVYMMGTTSPQQATRTLSTSPNPAATPAEDTVAFVQLARPTLLWIADWTVSRFKEKPKIPDPKAVESDWVFLDEHLEPGMITVGPDGVTPLFRISGTYFYGHKRPDATVIRNISFARPPFLQDFVSRDVPDSMFEAGLINSQRTLRAAPGPFPVG